MLYKKNDCLDTKNWQPISLLNAHYKIATRAIVGCPLSPLVYVISIEVLAVCICTSPQITGVALPSFLEEFRCSGYADDTTVAATTDTSIEETFHIYTLYERASGARLNRGKLKGMWEPSWKDCTDMPHGIQWVKDLPLSRHLQMLLFFWIK